MSEPSVGSNDNSKRRGTTGSCCCGNVVGDNRLMMMMVEGDDDDDDRMRCDWRFVWWVILAVAGSPDIYLSDIQQRKRIRKGTNSCSTLHTGREGGPFLMIRMSVGSAAETWFCKTLEKILLMNQGGYNLS